ncbi:uncharacterized protein N7477_005488 [Penicillium maclennaniae]|uniref:uncharacterized protein n=1 Tax=Penicillium maclennaniae TaxID=1343394 RepID=UPI002541E553|nr:uncharacterized protein N7477_005488 [Penicillium maclennaniae]KAJ5670125.1 hypothetical protein N7477_005488 [Penicillium maclennaniae]
MALPPEQINIKRRREEEPVETLYIQAALHQTKRRFTDFVFQRVTVSAKNIDDAAPAPSHPAAQRLLRSPRSVSSLYAPKQRAPQSTSSSGVPLVRATSPGAEIRDAQRKAAVQREADEQRKRALQPAPTVQSAPVSRVDSPVKGGEIRVLLHRMAGRIRLGSLRGSGGIQKRRDGESPRVAVLVEQLRRKPHSRQASMVADLVGRAPADEADVEAQDMVDTSPVKPRKRPVVNQAEKRWREERQNAISAAKQQISDTFEKAAQAKQSTWDEESEKLAREFEQVALEMEQDMEVDQDEGPVAPVQPTQYAPVSAPKPLKFQPRLPKQPRVVQPPPESKIEDASAQAEDNEDDYVYDSDQQMKQIEAANRGIGVIVITAEDEDVWEHFIEDDDEAWDSEDADSNAENNPANDYPDEELSSEDENDDPTAIYGKYRRQAVSDDEEFDLDYSDNEGGAQFGSGYGYQRRYGGMESDESF